jgi:hypothetical protein
LFRPTNAAVPEMSDEIRVLPAVVFVTSTCITSCESYATFVLCPAFAASAPARPAIAAPASAAPPVSSSRRATGPPCSVMPFPSDIVSVVCGARVYTRHRRT